MARGDARIRIVIENESALDALADLGEILERKAEDYEWDAEMQEAHQLWRQVRDGLTDRPA